MSIVAFPSEKSKLGNLCVKVPPLREGHLGRAASIAAGKRFLSASHSSKSSLCWLSYRQPWGEGSGGDTVSLVWGRSLMVAKMDFALYKGRASLGPNSMNKTTRASTVKPVVGTLFGSCLSAGCPWLQLFLAFGITWQSDGELSLLQAAQRHCSECKTAWSVRSFGIIIILEMIIIFFSRISQGMRYLLICILAWRSGQCCHHPLFCLSR